MANGEFSDTGVAASSLHAVHEAQGRFNVEAPLFHEAQLRRRDARR